MALKLNTTSGSITLVAEDGSGNVNVTLPRAGFESGDITGVTAGTGLTGGGASGAVTLTVGAAQTGITSIYATDLILGEDTQTAIDFGTANEIDFKVDNATRLTMTSGAVYPITTNQIDLGTASLEFKDAFFDGTVTSDAFAGPLTGNVTGNVSGTAGSATGNAATVTTNANLTGHITSTGNAAVLGSFTSAQLKAALSDETGSGTAVFATSPTLVTPVLGTPASGVATNLTGTAASLTAGNATTLATARTIHGVSFDGSANIDLSEEIADTVGAMVSSNTETNVTVTYQDIDNTLDFTIGTLNQDTTGLAGTATALATARTIHGVSFDGSANIDLSEEIADTVGAMVSSNTETNVTVTYQDIDNTLDFTIGTLNQDTTGLAGTATALATARTIGGTSFDGTANIVPGTATLATTTTVTDSAANTNFPVVFHNESNGLLDDTGALRYNPSTGQLLVPNLTVAGTTTQVDTVTMNAQNAVVFEGATADLHETTLSIVDPTADHTQYLINQGGYVPVLAAATTTAITSTPAELNALDGIPAGLTATEIGYVDGVTSAIQTQLNSKASGVAAASIKSANYTMSSGEFIIASAGSITLTLPASPSAGDNVTVKDGTGAAATTAFTVARNSSNIASSATDLTFDKNFHEVTMTYINSTIGWSV